ncbi:hypothetical protein E2C01_010270 [Portunus trituberculatus]|uniref:Uncharacterized protein n=1 Tax=Portunus trituberculatus TaxID=210409 RepID=A0A5B7D819_PORTR|nr:hypothetical protein [Portunus trituberculatus]
MSSDMSDDDSIDDKDYVQLSESTDRSGWLGTPLHMRRRGSVGDNKMRSATDANEQSTALPPTSCGISPATPPTAHPSTSCSSPPIHY